MTFILNSSLSISPPFSIRREAFDQVNPQCPTLYCIYLRPALYLPSFAPHLSLICPSFAPHLPLIWASYRDPCIFRLHLNCRCKSNELYTCLNRKFAHIRKQNKGLSFLVFILPLACHFWQSQQNDFKSPIPDELNPFERTLFFISIILLLHSCFCPNQMFCLKVDNIQIFVSNYYSPVYWLSSLWLIRLYFVCRLFIIHTHTHTHTFSLLLQIWSDFNYALWCWTSGWESKRE